MNKTSRPILIVLAIVLLLAGIGAGYDLYIEKPAAGVEPLGQGSFVDSSVQGRVVPDFGFVDRAGGLHRVADFRGKTVLLHFWASWCPPCITEFPGIVRFAAKHADDVVLIALSADKDHQALDNFLARQKADVQADLKLPSVLISLDSGQDVIMGIFQTMQFPETIIVDGKGNMVRKIVGDTDWGSARGESMLPLSQPIRKTQ